MMKKIKIIIGCALLISAMLTVGCSSYQPEDFSGGTPVSPEILDSIADELAKEENSEKYPEETDSEGNTLVCWTDGGSVWHRSSSCSALSSSQNIVKGSEEEAMAAGKTRVCSVCGNG